MNFLYSAPMKTKITPDMKKKLLEVGVTRQSIWNWTTGRSKPTKHYQYVIDKLREETKKSA